MTKTRGVMVLSFLACIALTGCMATPVDQQWFNNRNDEIEFAGFVGSPQQVVTVEVKRRSVNGSPEGWAYIAQTASGADPVFTDANGKWFHWSVKTRLGTDYTIWRSRSGGGHTRPGYEAFFRAYVGEASNPFILGMFRKDLGRCLNGDQLNACGGPRPQTAAEIMQTCGVGKQEITVNALD